MIKPAKKNVWIFTLLLLAVLGVSVAGAYASGSLNWNTDDLSGGSMNGSAFGSTGGSTGTKNGPGQFSVGAPTLSVKSGFYKDAFDLEMSCDPGCTIYYTLDGGDPEPRKAKAAATADIETTAADEKATDVVDATGATDTDATVTNATDAEHGAALVSSDPAVNPGTLQYDAPVWIEDATEHDNIWCMRTDTSTGFYEDLIMRYSDRDVPGYAAPDYKVDKCTALRAVAVDEKGNASPESTAVYFVGKKASDYDGCNIISISTEPSNLFDKQTGIYVTGNRFAHYLTRGKTKWYKWDANYYMSGPDSERDARVCIFDEKGEKTSEKPCEIRISGNVSRAYNQKSFSVFLKDAMGEPAALEPDIFGTGYHPEELILSSGGQNPTTKFNSYAVSQILGERFAMKHFAPSVVFLDGEYWGFYWVTERYDPDWFEYYMGTDRDNVVAVKFDGQPYYAVRSADALKREEESTLFEETEQFVAESDMSDPATYAKAGEYFDLDDFIDYYAIEVYLSNYDWPARNKELWRTWETAADLEADPYSDGRWRYLLYDLDLGMDTGFLFHANALQRALDKDDIFAALWENKEFRKKFRKRLFYWADEYFDPDQMDRMIDAYSERWSPALERSWRRFYREDVKNMEDFEKSMENRKKFFRQRREIAEGWFR